MNTEQGHIKIEKNKEVGIITLSKPDGLNLLDTSMLNDLEACLNEVGMDEQVRAVIVTGNKNFSTGADIREMEGFNPEEAEAFSRLGHRVLSQVEHMEKPVIAAVGGYALGGGCELALACDIRIAAEYARFGQPEVNLGLIPGFGGTQRLTRLIGIGKAKEMILTGNIIDARKAEAMGLVNEVTADRDVVERAREMAELIAQKGPVAVKLAKRLVNGAHDIQQGIEAETAAFNQCFATRDRIEGMKAFLEKRKPDFKGLININE